MASADSAALAAGGADAVPDAIAAARENSHGVKVGSARPISNRRGSVRQDSYRSRRPGLQQESVSEDVASVSYLLTLCELLVYLVCIYPVSCHPLHTSSRSLALPTCSFLVD